MKPLVRWTIGNVSKYGFETLFYSVKSFKKLYKDQFDYVICHNELNDFQKSEILKSEIKLFEQTPNCCNLKIKPSSSNAWKLFPPRLRPNSHEIFIDNDLIITKKIIEIDYFTKSKKMIVLEGGREKPAYGKFEKYVKKNLIICSCLFGFPPYYNPENTINDFLNKEKGDLEYFDEQGLVASLSCLQDTIIIPKQKINNCWLSLKKESSYGLHFAGVNRDAYLPWLKFKKGFI